LGICRMDEYEGGVEWPWDVDGLPEELEAAARRLAFEEHSRGPGDPKRRVCDDRSSFMRLSRSRDSNRILRSRAHSSSKLCPSGGPLLGCALSAMVVVGIEDPEGPGYGLDPVAN